MSYIQILSSQFPLVDFYKTVFPTNTMKIYVAKIYVQINYEFAWRSFGLLSWWKSQYACHPIPQFEGLPKKNVDKILDAITHPRSKFEPCISDIEAELKKLHDLRDAGHVAQTTDNMLELMSETSLGKLSEDVTIF